MQLGEALGIGPREIVTFVGGGGKTTAMYSLVRECAATGGRAIATGTTLFTPLPAQQRLELVLTEDLGDAGTGLAGALERTRCAIVAAGHGTKGRLLPMSPGEPARLQVDFDVSLMVVEGDGSRGRPFKAPADHEPVIAASSTLVVAVAGVSVLGQPLAEGHVHRPELVGAITGLRKGDAITVDALAQVLSDPRGGRKDVPDGCRFAVLLNQVEEERLEPARAVARRLREAGVERVVLARLEGAPVVVEVLAG